MNRDFIMWLAVGGLMLAMVGGVIGGTLLSKYRKTIFYTAAIMVGAGFVMMISAAIIGIIYKL